MYARVGGRTSGLKWYKGLGSAMRGFQTGGSNGRKVGVYAMKRVAAGAHLSIPWLFEPAERPDDRNDYCLGTRR